SLHIKTDCQALIWHNCATTTNRAAGSSTGALIAFEERTSMRIALLEDEHEQAQNVQAILAERGYECDSFPTAQSFLSSVLHRSYDLLILDWQIPDGTGVEVLESVRAQLNWPIPVIFLTQRDSESDIVRALDAGA